MSKIRSLLIEMFDPRKSTEARDAIVRSMILDPDPHEKRTLALPRVRQKQELVFTTHQVIEATEQLAKALADLASRHAELEQASEDNVRAVIGESFDEFQARLTTLKSKKIWLEEEHLPEAERAVAEARARHGLCKSSEAEIRADRLKAEILSADRKALDHLLAALDARWKSRRLREHQRAYLEVAVSGERAAGIDPLSRTGVQDALKLISDFKLLEDVWRVRSEHDYEKFLSLLEKRIGAFIKALPEAAPEPTEQSEQ